jgi:hypothetical protein
MHCATAGAGRNPNQRFMIASLFSPAALVAWHDAFASQKVLRRGNKTDGEVRPAWPGGTESPVGLVLLRVLRLRVLRLRYREPGIPEPIADEGRRLPVAKSA